MSDTFSVAYCALCHELVIVCPQCGNATCGVTAGCEFCDNEFKNSDMKWRDKYLRCGNLPDNIPVVGQGLDKALASISSKAE